MLNVNKINTLVSQGFAMQVDESTDKLVILFYLHLWYMYSNQVEEQMFMCKTLSLHTIGEDNLIWIRLYVVQKGLHWKQCVDICTNGTWSVVRKMHSFIVHIKIILPEWTGRYCVLHCQSLVQKMIPPVLKTMYDKVVWIVNLRKSRLFNSRILSALCDKIGGS